MRYPDACRLHRLATGISMQLPLISCNSGPHLVQIQRCASWIMDPSRPSETFGHLPFLPENLQYHFTKKGDLICYLTI
nr:MAG TPA: hypothetical protein [Caudoviricetes sp.]